MKPLCWLILGLFVPLRHYEVGGWPRIAIDLPWYRGMAVEHGYSNVRAPSGYPNWQRLAQYYCYIANPAALAWLRNSPFARKHLKRLRGCIIP